MSKKTTFQLQTVLNFKSSKVDMLETEFAGLKVTCQDEVVALRTLEQTSGRQMDALQRQQQEGGLNCQAIQLHQHYLHFLEENIKQQAIQVEQAKERVNDKRNELVEMLQDKKTLENLRAKHQSREARKLVLREAKMIDDLVTARYGREGYTHA